jgi:hypothetical protein
MDSLRFRREITAHLAALPHDDTPEEHKIAFQGIREVKLAPMGYVEQLKREQLKETCSPIDKSISRC